MPHPSHSTISLASLEDVPRQQAQTLNLNKRASSSPGKHVSCLEMPSKSDVVSRISRTPFALASSSSNSSSSSFSSSSPESESEVLSSSKSS
uniref:Uncharacterized protein n=1 Tax=Lepeophtheirus salmonis TaxID=72036 RepID=A0A0K2VGR1_LEPSM